MLAECRSAEILIFPESLARPLNASLACNGQIANAFAIQEIMLKEVPLNVDVLVKEIILNVIRGPEDRVLFQNQRHIVHQPDFASEIHASRKDQLAAASILQSVHSPLNGLIVQCDAIADGAVISCHESSHVSSYEIAFLYASAKLCFFRLDSQASGG